MVCHSRVLGIDKTGSLDIIYSILVTGQYNRLHRIRAQRRIRELENALFEELYNPKGYAAAGLPSAA